MKEQTLKISMKTSLVWQILACLCAFFACSFVTGMEGLFCALAAAFATAMFFSGMKAFSFLSTTAGALLGYAFALWSEDGGVVSIAIDEPLLFANTVDFTLDLRVLGAIELATLGVMIALSIFLVGRGYARTALVGANTFVLAVSQAAGFVLIFRAKYGVFSWELLREKIQLLGDCLGKLLSASVAAQPVEGAVEGILNFQALGQSIVYTLPLMFLVSCGICAFFHSYLCKRLLRKCGFLSPQEPWIFLPGLTSAFVYLGLSAASFLLSALDGTNASAYALSLLSGLLAWLFFVPGLSALRLWLQSRKRQGRKVPWLLLIVLAVMFPFLLGILLNMIPTVGLVFTMVEGFKKKAREKQNLN